MLSKLVSLSCATLRTEVPSAKVYWGRRSNCKSSLSDSLSPVVTYVSRVSSFSKLSQNKVFSFACTEVKVKLTKSIILKRSVIKAINTFIQMLVVFHNWRRQRASVERRLGVVVGADCFTLTKTWNRKPDSRKIDRHPKSTFYRNPTATRTSEKQLDKQNTPICTWSTRASQRVGFGHPTHFLCVDINGTLGTFSLP